MLVLTTSFMRNRVEDVSIRPLITRNPTNMLVQAGMRLLTEQNPQLAKCPFSGSCEV